MSKKNQRAREEILEKIVGHVGRRGDQCYLMVYEFFNEDQAKTANWFFTCDPLLEQLRPIDLLGSGKVEKLKRFIGDCYEAAGRDRPTVRRTRG